jgi:hypothetical protein
VLSLWGDLCWFLSVTWAWSILLTSNAILEIHAHTPLRCGSWVLGNIFHAATLTVWSPKLIYIMFKNSVRTAKKTSHFTITQINWLMLFKEIIAVYTENHTKSINTKWRFDCWSRWDIHLLLGFKGLNLECRANLTNNLISLSQIEEFRLLKTKLCFRHNCSIKYTE